MPEIRERSGRTLFEDTVNILHFLEADRAAPYAKRQHRDRQIGQGACENILDQPLKTVQCWWQQISADRPGEHNEGNKLIRVRGLVGLAAVVFGLLSGLGVIAAVFQYDGSHPINVVTLIAVFVILQSVFIGTSLLMLLPGQNFLSRALASLNVGAMISGIMHRTLLKSSSSSVFFMGTSDHTQAHNLLLRWQLFSWSQLLGCAFNTGALLGAVLLIVFTDLAFGWSSTLMFETVQFQKLIYLVSLPWAGIWPDASPTQALIEQSRFYRLGAEQATPFIAQSLTAWWPFVVACILSYGLLPRVVLLSISRVFVQRALATLLMDNPQVISLLDRMRTPEVALGSPVLISPEMLLDEEPHAKPNSISGSVPLIIWADAAERFQLLSRLEKDSSVQVSQAYKAGGACSMAEDMETITTLLEKRSDSILIAVKSWEPPLNDMLDFIALLRQKCGDKTQIILFPLGPDLSVADQQEVRIWRHASKRLSDAQLFVEPDL